MEMEDRKEYIMEERRDKINYYLDIADAVARKSYLP